MTLDLDPFLNLGRDTERMTAEDKRRQEAATNHLLHAFSAPPAERREVQLPADEVGLGKTFVALATAYSLLRAVRTRPQAADGSRQLWSCNRHTNARPALRRDTFPRRPDDPR